MICAWKLSTHCRYGKVDNDRQFIASSAPKTSPALRETRAIDHDKSFKHAVISCRVVSAVRDICLGFSVLSRECKAIVSAEMRVAQWLQPPRSLRNFQHRPCSTTVGKKVRKNHRRQCLIFLVASTILWFDQTPNYGIRRWGK